MPLRLIVNAPEHADLEIELNIRGTQASVMRTSNVEPPPPMPRSDSGEPMRVQVKAPPSHSRVPLRIDVNVPDEPPPMPPQAQAPPPQVRLPGRAGPLQSETTAGAAAAAREQPTVVSSSPQADPGPPLPMALQVKAPPPPVPRPLPGKAGPPQDDMSLRGAQQADPVPPPQSPPHDSGEPMPCGPPLQAKSPTVVGCVRPKQPPPQLPLQEEAVPQLPQQAAGPMQPQATAVTANVPMQRHDGEPPPPHDGPPPPPHCVKPPPPQLQTMQMPVTAKHASAQSAARVAQAASAPQADDDKWSTVGNPGDFEQ